MTRVVEEAIKVATTQGDYSMAAKVRRASDDWVVFLHGWGCAKECFDGAFVLPGLRNYSMCSLDFLGFGQSDKPQEFSYDLADHAQTAARVIRSFNARKVYLVGHSMGGGVGLLCTKAIRDNLQLFVSVEGNLVPTDSRAMRKLASHTYPVFRRIYFPLIQRTIRASKRQDYRQWSRWLDAADARAAYQSARSATRWSDSGKLLAMFLKLPNKAYIYGESSERGPYVLPKLAGVETRKIPRSQHFPMVDNPKDFYKELEELIINTDKEHRGQ
jgi:pimeloyl-ACP methyl ester carboxylesterase